MSENRKRPVLAPLRTTRPDRALIDLVAAREGIPTSELLHRIVMPEVRRRARTYIADLSPEETREGATEADR